MNILDRYIARQFILNVLLLFLILFCLIVAIDASFNVDRFWRISGTRLQEAGKTASTARQALMAAWLVLDLWGPRLLLLFNFLLGIVMVGAVGFTCAQMARHREFVAVMAGGISLTHLTRPVFLVAISLIAIQILNQELVLPRFAHLLTREHRDAGRHELGLQGRLLVPDGLGRVFYIQAFDADQGQITGVSILERDQQRRGMRRIDADSGHWDGSGWVLSGVRVVELEGTGAVVNEGAARIETDLGPTSLRIRRYSRYARNLSTAEIARMLEGNPSMEPRVRDQLQQVRFGRFSSMIVNLLALAIALPFYLTRDPPNPVLQSLRCAPIAGLALIGGVLGVVTRIPGVPPGISVFVPVIVLAPIAAVMLTSIRT